MRPHNDMRSGIPQVPFGTALAELAALVESGKLSIHVDRTFPLEAAAQAQVLNRAGHTRGKIILVIRE